MRYSKIAAAVIACSMLFGGCSAKVDSSDVVMTVGDVKVTENEFNYYMNSYKENFNYGAAKETSLEYCEKNSKILAVATAMGLDLEDSERSVEAEKETFKASLGGEKAYKEYLKQNNISDNYMTNLISTNIYAQLLAENMDAVEFSDADKRAYFKENYRSAKYFRMLKANAETIEAIKSKADEFVARLNAGESFDTIFHEAFEEKLADSAVSGVFTDNENSLDYQNTVDSIGDGESIVMENDESFYVIQRLALSEEDYESEIADIESLMQDAHFNEQIEALAEEYGIKTVINQDVLDTIE